MENFLFEKPESMSNDDFLKYLFFNKTEFDLSWGDIAEIMNKYEIKDFSEDKYRKQCKNFTNINDQKENLNEIDVESELNFQIEIQRLKDERSQLNSVYRQVSRENYLKDIAIECAEKLSSTNPFVNVFKKESTKPFNKKEGLLEISDWHYGIQVDNHWNKYSPEICVKRVQCLLTKTLELIKNNNINKLHVLNLGDLISGRIHSQIRIENKEDVISQVMNVSELLANFLFELSKHVDVEYYDCLDNHSRVEPNKKESLRLESLARITNWFLMERFKNCNNVHINVNEYSDDIIMFKALNWSIAGVHGDLDRLNKVVKNIQLFTHNNIDLICTAHLHHFSCDEENGCTVVTNPSLMGMDSFAESKRLYSKPAQTFLLISDRQPVESIHRILLDD